MNGKTLILVALAAGVLVTGCDRIQQMQKPKSETPGPYAFGMAVEMTPRALAKMKAEENHIRISAFYYGFAKPQFRDKADELNRIQLSSESYDYPADATKVYFPGQDVDVKKLDQIERSEVWVLSNVGSMDKQKFPNDLLDCKEFTGPVETARTVPLTAKCDLGEEYK